MITCPTCGEQNPERARFCVACGTPLVTGGSDEERKMVTVVFTDLVAGSEPHPEDPEELRNLLQAYQSLVSRYVTSHGEAVVVEAEGLPDEAAAGYEKLAPEWVDYGFALEEARVRLGLGRTLLLLQRRDEACDELVKARALARDLGAEPVAAEADALLEGAPTP